MGIDGWRGSLSWTGALAALALLAGCASSALEAPPRVAAGTPDPCVLKENPPKPLVYAVPRPSAGRAGACDVRERTLAVNGEGRFRTVYGAAPPGQQVLPSQAIDPVINLLKARAASLGEGEPLKILIFVHGGLVSHGRAVQSAEGLTPGMRADGFEPVFLVWDSDMAASYGERLCCVRNGEHWIGDRTLFIPARLVGDVGASVARAPENYEQEYLRYWDSTIAPKGTRYELRSEDELRLCKRLGQEDGGCLSLTYPPFDDDHLNRLGARLEAETVQHDLLFPVRLIGVTALPEVGTEAWDNMVRRTRLALEYATSGPQRAASAELATSCESLTREADEDTRGNLKTEASGRGRDRFRPIVSGGFALFFERLNCEIDEGGFVRIDSKGGVEPVQVQLYFYGHSMGALVGDEIIWRYPNLPWTRIVYMAAASSIRDFRTQVMPILNCSREPGRDQSTPCSQHVQFYSLMLHPLTEARELELGGLPPQGSLLVWIDEMFGGPRTVDDRTLGRWFNIEQTIQLFPPQVRSRMHFRVFPSQGDLRDGDAAERAAFYRECEPGPGKVFAKGAGKGTEPIDSSTRCHPVKHGEFADYSFWRDGFLGGPN
jgi:hypothetical protein